MPCAAKFVTMQKPFRIRERAGFTLVEVLVSIAILAIIMVVMSQTTNALRQTIGQATAEISEFQQAQTAFETMTRRISQATLNTYNDVDPITSASIPGYTRASELRFISGPASLTVPAVASGNTGALIGTTGATSASVYRPSHAIFFQAPVGKSSSSSYANLAQLLNTCGYYIEWNSDQALGLLPSFLPATYPARWRYRLMELIEPSDSLTIYNKTSGANSGNTASLSWYYDGLDWFQTPLKTASNVHPIADNVICLAILPMNPPEDATTPPGGAVDGTSTDLAPNYLYDTSPTQSTTVTTTPYSQNHLPPMVYVLMIAVDEKSFSRYEASRSSPTTCPPYSDLGLDDSVGGGSTFLTNATYANRWGTTGDLTNVENDLTAKHIKYRVFSIALPLTAN